MTAARQRWSLFRSTDVPTFTPSADVPEAQVHLRIIVADYTLDAIGDPAAFEPTEFRYTVYRKDGTKVGEGLTWDATWQLLQLDAEFGIGGGRSAPGR